MNWKTTLVTTGVPALLPSSAVAGNWMLVGAEVATPDRRHFDVEFDRLDQRYDSL